MKQRLLYAAGVMARVAVVIVFAALGDPVHADEFAGWSKKSCGGC